MATLFDLAQQYLNRALPETFRYAPRTPTTPPPVTVPPQDPNAPTARILPMPSGGGDGYSVYNADPNSISNKNYSPYAYRQAAERNLIGTPGGSLTGTNIPNTSTEVAKLMDMYPDYYTGPQLTGIPGAIAAYAKASPLMQLAGKGLDALGNMMPVNRRAIYENELASDGIMVNDIGQIVSDGGNINTAQNIMAGYNAAKVDADTFAKRRAVIEKNMKDPVQKAAKLKALDEAEAIMLGTAKKRTDMIFEDKMITKDPSLKGPGYLEDAFDFTTETPSFITDNSIVSNNIIGGTNLNDYDGIMSTYTPSPGDLGYISPTAPITSGSVLADKNINRIIDDVDIPGGKDDGPSSGTIIDAGGTAPDGGYATDYYGGDSVTDAGGTAPGGGYATDYYGGGGDQYSDDNYMAGDTSTAASSGSIFDGGSAYEDQSYSGGSDSGGGNNSGGKSIVCTAMYQTTGLEDWSKAMKIWYIYQKKYLTIQHQEGYHKLFKPFVKGMHKNKIIRAIGAHIAKHRTQDLKHIMFGSKSSWLGRVYRKILEPICYFVGKHG